MQRSTPYRAIVSNRTLDRRTLLRGAGVSLALPWLSAMSPLSARASQPLAPQRFVALTLGLGLHAPNWIPDDTGPDYKPSRYLESLQDLRDRITVISGTSHPGVKGGHRAEACILTANPMATSGRARNSISLDQLLAKELGQSTRFPSLVLGAGGSNSPSYTDTGSMVPAESSPARLFNRLFIDDSPEEQLKQDQRIREGRSVMDLVAEDARGLQRQLGSADRQRLDAYFTSVRDLEHRLAQAQQWALLPKPQLDVPAPQDINDPNDLVGRQKTMCDVIRLALKTDSTRFITFHLGAGSSVLPLEGVREGYHALSHHGMDDDKLSQLTVVEQALLDQWGDFLRDLQQTDDSTGCLLDNTSVLLTSNLGNGSNHDNRNMPVFLAGGRFRHGRHLAFDQKNNYPLPNLYVSLLQQIGLPIDHFASSTGTMNGLDFLS